MHRGRWRMLKFYHCNHSVLDMSRSVKFYKEQFGLTVFKEINAYNGDLHLVFLSDGVSDFLLELTWYKNHKNPYNQGDKEFHLAFRTDDYDRLLTKHKNAGILKHEEPELRLYFVEDPDGYQIEVVEKLEKESGKK